MKRDGRPADAITIFHQIIMTFFVIGFAGAMKVTDDGINITFDASMIYSFIPIVLY
jgi:hypothetical protein